MSSDDKRTPYIPLDPLSIPAVRAAVDQAVEPYRDVVTPEVLEEMRKDLADFLVMHPVTDRLSRRLRKPPRPAASALTMSRISAACVSAPPPRRGA